ncbi:unnamed protein product [Dicrocoelium dendriticum]|nr:unnamed protein product [Dicrocoelium dendriticum]
MDLHNHVLITWLLLKQTAGLTFSVNLSSKISQMYYGQLLTYFTFVDGGTASLSYETLGQVPPSGYLYLFAAGTQRMTGSYSPSTCINFYARSIRNVSLNVHKRGVFILDPFAGYFPTFLVFSDNSSCNQTIPVFADTSRVTITLLNPNGQPQSGTLIGLRAHVAGLFSVYTAAVLYALYCLCSSKRCDRCHRANRVDTFGFGFEAGKGAMSVIDDATKHSSNQVCCPCTSAKLSNAPYSTPYSRSIVALNGQEKQLCYLLALLCLQCFASVLAWLEFSRFSSTIVSTNRPVFGADGSRSHFAELLSVASHYVFMGLLMSQAIAADTSGVTEYHDCRHHTLRRTATFKSESSTPSLPNFSGHRISLPVLSVFRLGRTLSLHRLTWLLLFSQVMWYGFIHYSNSTVAYAEPEMWPTEEQHGFWAGLGIPGTNYLSWESSTSTSHLRSSYPPSGLFAHLLAMTLILTGSTSVLAIIISSLRTGLGLVLATRLAQIGRIHRSSEMRNFYTRFGWLGTAWFTAHPLLLLTGALFADHVRYKMVVVGVTLIQAAVVVSVLMLFTRQTLLWDISALSASLPLLRRIPPPNSK